MLGDRIPTKAVPPVDSRFAAEPVERFDLVGARVIGRSDFFAGKLLVLERGSGEQLVLVFAGQADFREERRLHRMTIATVEETVEDVGGAPMRTIELRGHNGGRFVGAARAAQAVPHPYRLGERVLTVKHLEPTTDPVFVKAKVVRLGVYSEPDEYLDPLAWRWPEIDVEPGFWFRGERRLADSPTVRPLDGPPRAKHPARPARRLAVVGPPERGVETDVVRRLSALEAAADDGPEFTSLLDELLSYLRAVPADQRSQAERALIRLLDHWPDGSTQVLQFTMRELRWDGVRAALIDLRHSDADFRHRDLALKMLRAFHAPDRPRPGSRAVYKEIEIGAPYPSTPRL